MQEKLYVHSMPIILQSVLVLLRPDRTEVIPGLKEPTLAYNSYSSFS